MDNFTTTNEFLISIFEGQVPGLFEITKCGYLGEYRLFNVVYADLCQLWKFDIMQHQGVLNDYKFNPVYDDNKEEIDGWSEVFPVEIKLSCSYEVE